MNQPLVTQSTRDTGSRIRELTLAILYSVPFGGFPLVWAGWLLVTLPEQYQAEVDFRAKALLTSGVVIDKEQSHTCSGGGGLVPLSCSSICNVKVKFKKSEGRIAEFWDSCYKSANEQAIPVLYDPTNVIKARIDRGNTPESLARGQFISSMILGLLGIVGITCCSPCCSPTENNQKQS